MNSLRKFIKNTLKEHIISEELNTISLQQARDKKLFGPVYHGSSQENLEKIGREGFKIFHGTRGDENISHGYPANSTYAMGFPPPVHHLGYGIYFTTVKAIAKQFNQNTTKGIREFFLNTPRILEINFQSPEKMMKWWVANGYDGELAKTGEQGRIQATKKLTDYLSSKYDAVWFKGKGFMKRNLDGDQIVVFDTNNIFTVNPELSAPMEIGARVKRKTAKYETIITYDTETGKSEREQTNKIQIPAGVSGIIMTKNPAEPMRNHWREIGNSTPHWTEGSEFVYSVKWSKGGTEGNILDSMLEPYQKTIQEGHYTTWRNLDEDIEEFQGTEVDIVRKIAKKLGINRYAPAGQGSHGFAYYIPNNRILKITKDRGEASESFKIKGKKNKHISDIYEVFTLSGAYQDTYVVVSELLGRSEEIDELEDSLVWFFNFVLEVNFSRFIANYSKGYFDKSRMNYFLSRVKNEYNKPNRERLLWYYQQRIALIDELVKNNIKTEDWETHNLGLKKNGNLAMFDLGANHTELQSSIPNIELQEWKFTADEYPDFMDTQYNPAMANRPYPPLANVNSSPLTEQNFDEEKVYTLLKKLGASDAQYIGNGFFGDAYALEDKVYKFTRDTEEARLSHKLVGKTFNHIANVYRVMRYEERPSRWIYIIIMERLGKLGQREREVFSFYEDALDAFEKYDNSFSGDELTFDYFINNIDLPDFSDFLYTGIENLADIIKEYKNDILDIYQQVKNTKAEVDKALPKIITRQYGGTADRNLTDLHGGNVGKKSNGNLAFFDMRWSGFSDTPRRMKTLKETDINTDVEKKHLPYKHPELLQRFISFETEANIRSVAPEINLQRPPLEIIKDFDHFYPSLFDNFAEWIFKLSGDQLSENKTSEKKIYYHGRTKNRPYRGEYIFLSDDMEYAASYSDMKIVFSYTLNIPESKLFSFLNPAHKKLLAQAIGPQAMHSIEQSSRGEMDWAALNSVANDDYEMGEDLIESLGFRGIKLSERPGINSVYLFHQSDATQLEEIDLNTPKNKQFLSKWFTDKEKEWNYQGS